MTSKENTESDGLKVLSKRHFQRCTERRVLPCAARITSRRMFVSFPKRFMETSALREFLDINSDAEQWLLVIICCRCLWSLKIRASFSFALPNAERLVRSADMDNFCTSRLPLPPPALRPTRLRAHTNRTPKGQTLRSDSEWLRGDRSGIIKWFRIWL